MRLPFIRIYFLMSQGGYEVRLGSDSNQSKTGNTLSKNFLINTQPDNNQKSIRTEITGSKRLSMFKSRGTGTFLYTCDPDFSLRFQSDWKQLMTKQNFVTQKA